MANSFVHCKVDHPASNGRLELVYSQLHESDRFCMARFQRLHMVLQRIYLFQNGRNRVLGLDRAICMVCSIYTGNFHSNVLEILLMARQHGCVQILKLVQSTTCFVVGGSGNHAAAHATRGTSF
jgi:hypothetical protein